MVKVVAPTSQLTKEELERLRKTGGTTEKEKEKLEFKDIPSTTLAEEGRVLERGEKSFIIPTKEFRKLQARGKLDPSQQLKLEETERLEGERIRQELIKETQAPFVEEEGLKPVISKDEQVGGIQKVIDFVAKFGIDVARDRDIIPGGALGRQLENEIESGKTAQEIIDMPGGTELGLISAGLEIGGTLLAGKALFPKAAPGDSIEILFKGKGVSKAQKLIRKDAAVTKIETTWGVSRSTAESIYTATNKKTTAEILKLLRKPVGKGVTGIIGADVLAVWYASDNLNDGINFVSNDLIDAVKIGSISVDDALAIMDEMQGHRDTATNTIDISTSANPFLMPFKKLFDSGIDKSQIQFDLKRAEIEALR